jgi:hypothetical protein
MTTKVHVVSRYCYSIDGRGGSEGGLQLWGPEGIQRLRVHFVPDSVEPPVPTLAADLEWATCHLRASMLQPLVDMLRHEAPVRVTLDDRPPGAVFVHTGEQPMGLSRPSLEPPLQLLVSSGTALLQGTWTFDLETGTSGHGPDRDLWWEQVDSVRRRLRPQNGALLAHLGAVDFDSLTPEAIRRAPFSPAPVDGSRSEGNQLTAGTVLAVRTAAGNLAKVEVLAYGYDLRIRWATYLDDTARPPRQPTGGLTSRSTVGAGS